MRLDQDNPKGQGVLEYALLLLLLGAALVTVLSATGTSLTEAYCLTVSLFNENACQTDLVDWELYSGDCTANGAQVCCSNYGYIFSNDYQGENYTINVSGADLSEGMGYGIYFRTTRENGSFNGYNFQYDPGYAGGAFLFREWVNGHELSPFGREDQSAFDWYAKPRDLTIDVNGETFTAYVDGEQVLTGSDESFGNGGVGVRVWGGSELCIDSISVQTK